MRYKSLFLLAISLSLTGCQYWQSPDSEHNARCQELKHRMIFAGVTPSQSQAWEQESEQAKLAQSYQEEHCK
jgi:hypothetical protein